MRLTTAFMLACLLALSGTAHAADHLDAPGVEDDGRLDINDLYAFQSPANANNTVLIMTVNPAAGVFSPMSFNSRGVYELNIDNTGDAVADITYSFTFGRSRRGSQSVVCRRNGRLIARGTTGSRNISVRRGGGTLRCDLFEDPFFFDLNGFNDEFNFTGDDFFEGLNVSAIVLEVPSSQLNGSTSNIAVWARTTVAGDQFDRMGRPAINTALIPSDSKDAFNDGDPTDDRDDFGAIVRASITALGGDPNLADTLLPDVLTFDTSSADGFFNGRRLADDVIDAELGLLTGGAVTGDGVDQNDAAFRNVFPYLADANAP